MYQLMNNYSFIQKLRLVISNQIAHSRLCTFTLLLVGIIISPSMPRQLSLQNAVDTALQNNNSIKQYKEKIRQKVYDEKNSWGNIAPSISLAAGFTYLNDPLTINLDPLRDAMLSLQSIDQVSFANIQSQLKGGPAIDNTASPLYQSVYKTAYAKLDNALPHFIDTLKNQEYPSLSISIVQPLFTGGKISAGIRAAHAEKSATTFEMQRIQNDVIGEVIHYYLVTAMVNDVVTVREDVLSAMEKHRIHAEKLMEQGVIARYHYLRAEVAVSVARRNLLHDRNNLEVARMALQKSINSSSTLVDSLQPVTYHVFCDTIETLITKALKEQPVFEIVHRKQEMAKQKVKSQIAGFLPQIAAFGKYEFFSHYLSALEPKWAVGVSATIPIFNGLKNITHLQSSRSLVNELQYVEAGMQEDIKLWVKKAYKDMRSTEELYMLLDADLELANENLRQCKSRFENGYGTSLEVIDAQCVLEKNMIERLVAVHDYCMSILDLTTAGGHSEVFLTWFKGDKL